METQRLVLRPWKETDAEALYELARDPQIGPSAGWRPHVSKANSLKVLREVLIKPGEYAIIEKTTGAIIGSIGVIPSQRSIIGGLQEEDLTIGFWIGRDRWDQGFATEAAGAVLNEAFSDSKISNVWASSFEGNHRSERVQQKLGMEYKFSEFIGHPLLHEACMINVSCISREKYQQKTDN